MTNKNLGPYRDAPMLTPTEDDLTLYYVIISFVNKKGQTTIRCEWILARESHLAIETLRRKSDVTIEAVWFQEAISRTDFDFAKPDIVVK